MVCKREFYSRYILVVHNVQKKNHYHKMMNRLAIVLLILLVNTLVGQNIWEPIYFPDTLKSKAINSEKEGIIFVATGGNGEYYGLLRTIDNGISWELLELDSLYSNVNIFTIRYKSEETLFVGTGSGIYRSFNDGDNFEKVFTGGSNVLRLIFSPTNEIYAACWSEILRSVDNGITWDTLLMGGGSMYFSDIDFGLNGEIYAVGGSFAGPGTGSGFHRSLDNGYTWENIGITNLHLNNIEVNFDGDILVGGSGTSIYVSTDIGINWTIHTELLTTAIESDHMDNLFAGVNGYNYEGFRFSSDWGNNWTNLNDNILNPFINQISISPDNTVYLQCENFSSQQNQLFKSINPIVSTIELEINPEIKLFPNPTNYKLHFLSNNIAEIKQIILYNLNGQQLLVQKLTENIIDVSDLKSGLYIIEFEFENETLIKKILVE